jgi:hypothetical protein
MGIVGLAEIGLSLCALIFAIVAFVRVNRLKAELERRAQAEPRYPQPLPPIPGQWSGPPPGPYGPR